MESCLSEGLERCHVTTMIWRTVPFVLLLVGTMGNVLNMVIVLRPGMRKYTTSVYLFTLACSDLSLLWISVLPDAIRWGFDYDLLNIRFICKTNFWLSHSVAGVSISILMFMTVERLLITRSPIKSRLILSRKKSIIASVTSIFMMLLFLSHYTVVFDVMTTTLDASNQTRQFEVANQTTHVEGNNQTTHVESNNQTMSSEMEIVGEDHTAHTESVVDNTTRHFEGNNHTTGIVCNNQTLDIEMQICNQCKNRTLSMEMPACNQTSEFDAINQTSHTEGTNRAKENEGNTQTVNEINTQTVNEVNNQTENEVNNQTENEGNNQTENEGNSQTESEGNMQVDSEGNAQTKGHEGNTHTQGWPRIGSNTRRSSDSELVSLTCTYSSDLAERFYKSFWRPFIAFVNLMHILVIAVGNSLIVMTLTMQRKLLCATGNSQVYKQRMEGSRMLFVLSAFFFITTIPYCYYRLVYVDSFGLYHAIVKLLMYCNFSCNFFLYFLTGAMFKREWKLLVSDVKEKLSKVCSSKKPGQT